MDIIYWHVHGKICIIYNLKKVVLKDLENLLVDHFIHMFTYHQHNKKIRPWSKVDVFMKMSIAMGNFMHSHKKKP